MQAHLLITGKVQGIGYRQYVKSYAKKTSLNGWVKNVENGSVEALVQGNKEDIEEIIKRCRRGPFLAVVEDAQVNWEEETTPYDSFTILK